MKYYNSLKNYNEINYPYSMSYVNESPYTHRHSFCDKEGFHVILGHSKHLFTYPRVRDFSLSLKVKFADFFVSQVRTQFGILFAYNEETRSGRKIDFIYDYIQHKFYIGIRRFTDLSEEVLQETCIEEVSFAPSSTHEIKLDCKQGRLCCSFGEYSFDFKLDTDTLGKLGVYTITAHKEIVFLEAVIDDYNANVTPKERFSTTLHIPNKNGGERPYDLDLSFVEYPDNITQLNFTLKGGISSKEKYQLHNNDWNFCYDDIYNPYIELIKNGVRQKYYLYREKGMFVDSNAWSHLCEVYKTVENVKETPLSGSFFIENCKYSHYGFGYEKFDAFGTQSMVGAYEYIYDNEKLTYAGLPLDKSVVFSLKSFDKQIEKFIPKTLYDYEKAIEHIKANHYFLVQEHPHFMVDLYFVLDEKFLKVEIELTDAFLDRIASISTTSIERNESFSLLNYRNRQIYFTLDALPVGVYHIVVNVFYGNKLFTTHRSAFEVIDKSNNISPQQASNLPRMYFGDGGPIGHESGNPDFYSEKAELNWNHYFSIAHYTPTIQEKKRIWELTSVFNRELFAWMTRRTIDGLDWHSFKGVLSNVDYIYLPYPGLEDCIHYYRYDLYDITTYGNQMLTILQSFIDENPIIAKELNLFDVRSEFSKEKFFALLKKFGVKWINYALPKIEESFSEQRKELALFNGKCKSSSYGPLPSYYSPYNSGYATKWYGFDPKTYNRIFDGFLQYEDYPYCCAYSTCRGAWMLATAKLLNRNITIFPEVYLNFPYACPDSAVVCAHPPLAYSFHPVYYTLTQMYEYAYNSFYLDKQGFNCWDDYGFSIFNNIDLPYEREEVFLKLWGNLLKHKPEKPLKTVVFLYEIDPDDDRYDLEKRNNHFYNISESNFSYIYGLLKQNGFTAGYPVSIDAFLTLDTDEVSCLVLPNISHFEDAVIRKIKDFKEKNIPIICAGKLGKSDALFGVKTFERTIGVTQVKNQIESEYVTPNSCELFYESVKEKSILSTDNDDSVLMATNGCLIFNTSISQVGIEDTGVIDHHGKENISRLLKESLLQWANDNIHTIVKADNNVGVSVLKDVHGKTLLLITDYSIPNQKELDKIYVRNVKFNLNRYEDARYIDICNSELSYSKLISDNCLAGIQVSLRPQETVMFELIERLQK